MMDVSLKPEEQQSLKQMIGGSSKVRLSLLYKISRDGCNPWTFHTKCDSQGPTVTVIYNTNDTVYGGYTSQSWLGAGTAYNAYDENAFLFQVRYNGISVQKKFLIKADMYDAAITCGHKYGPIFGKENPDLPYFLNQKIDPSDGVYTFNSGKLDNAYDMKGTDTLAFSNNSVEVNDLEVYKVDGE